MSNFQMSERDIEEGKSLTTADHNLESISDRTELNVIDNITFYSQPFDSDADQDDFTGVETSSVFSCPIDYDEDWNLI